MEPFELRGRFWVPQEPNLEFEAELRFDPKEGSTLVLSGGSLAFVADRLDRVVSQDFPRFLRADALTFDIICGHLGSRAVTLFNCYPINILDTVYAVTVVFFGCHFKNRSDLTFDALTLRYVHLENWLGISGFTGYLRDTSRRGTTRLKFKYDQPRRTVISLKNLSIVFSHSFSWTVGSFPEYRFRQYTDVTFKPLHALQYTDFQVKLTKPFRHFLCLALGQPVLTDSVHGRSQRCDRRMRSKQGRENPISIFYLATGSENVVSDWHYIEPLFTFDDVKDRVSTYLEFWYQKHEQLNAAVELYFGLFYGKSLPLDIELLILAQVFEAYHRDRYEGHYLPDDEFENLLNRLIAAIPVNIDKNFKQALKQRLSFANEYSLRKRLTKIISMVLEPYQEHVQRLIGKREVFVAQVVELRNAITHPSTGRIIGYGRDPREMKLVVDRLKLLFAICLLREMEMSAETVGKVLEKYRPYRNLRQ